jgi:hypothetical protein
MNPAAIAPNAVSFALTGVLATSILFKRGKSTLHWTMAALLLGISIWAGGSVWRHQATTLPDLLDSFRLMYVGVALVPPAWLLLACRFAELRWLESRPELSGGTRACLLRALPDQ